MQRSLDLKDGSRECDWKDAEALHSISLFLERVSLCWGHTVNCAYMYVSLLWSDVQVKIWNKIWVSHVICKVKTRRVTIWQTSHNHFKRNHLLVFLGDPDLMALYEQGQRFISTAVTVCEGRSALIDRGRFCLPTWLRVLCVLCSHALHSSYSLIGSRMRAFGQS